MKKILVFTIVSCLGLGLYAQQGLFSGWKLRSFGLSMGLEQDMVQGFGGESFIRMSGYDALFDDLGVEPGDLSVYGGICENPHLRFQAIFEPSFVPNWEVHTSLVAIINRIDGITYYSQDELGYINSEYLTLDAWGHEIAADMAIIRRLRLGPLSVYGGVGTNLGFNFGNDLHISANYDQRTQLSSFSETGLARRDYEEASNPQFFSEHKEMSNGISQRIYAQAGASLTLLNRLELGGELRYGYGYRLHFGGNAIATNLQSFGLFARWNLK